MLKVSDAFNSAFAAPDRELHARVTIGKTVYDSDDLTSINYDSGAMTGEQFSIGSTYMNSTKITFSHLVEGLKQLDEVLVEFGVLKPDGAVEYVKMGTFIVDDKIQMDRNNNTTTIECMDRMTMLGGAYVSKLTYPARIKDVAVEIVNMAGVKANETSFARLSENKINQPTGYTYRDAIGLIAQFQMGFALFDRDGLLDIRTLQDNSFKIDPNQYFLKGLVKNETFFKLNGISCTVVTTSKDENGNETSKTTVLQSGSSSGAQIKLANNVMTQDVLDRMYEALKFTNYYPFSLNWNGNPAVEAGDWLTVEDLQGNEFKVPNMSYTLTYNGGLTATSKADTSVSSPATYSYGGTISNIVNEIGGRESAEGNHIYEGTEDQEPTLSKEGDLWYKHVGPDTEEWIYKDGKWKFLTSTKTANGAADAANKASKEAEEAKKQANKAVDGANDAVAKAGFANDTAEEAKSDAATAQKDATGALNSALDAQSDASIAVTQASSAASDSKDAKQIAGSVSQSYKTLTDGSTMTIAELESGLAAKLTKTDLDGYSTQSWTQNQIKMTADGISGTMSSIKSTVDGQTTSINDLKADSSSFKSQFTTVNNTLGKQTTDISTLQTTSKELTTGFNTLTTDNGTNKNDISQLKQTATELNSTMMTVQTQVQNSAVGTNLYQDTRDFDNPTVWNNFGNWTKTGEVYDGMTVMSTTGDWRGLSQNWAVKKGETYTFSIYARYKSGTGESNIFTGPSGADIASMQYSLNETWQRISIKFMAAEAVLIAPKLERSNNNTNTLLIAGPKLERGSVMTDYSTSPLDNATVTAFSKLSQTVDGMQFDISKKIEQKDLNGYATQTWTQGQIKSTADSINLSVSKVQTDLSGTKTQFAALEVKVNGIQTTVSGKADQSQVTQLANQMTSVVSDVASINDGGRNYFSNSTFNDPDMSIWSPMPYPDLNLKIIRSGFAGFMNKAAIHIVGTTSHDLNGISQTTNLPGSGDEFAFISFLAATTASGVNTLLHVGCNFMQGTTAVGAGSVNVDLSKLSRRERIKVSIKGPNTWWDHVIVGISPLANKAIDVWMTELKAEVYKFTAWTPAIEDSISKSQITQMKDLINLRVQKGDVINQINISPESILIAGQKVHITGQTSIDKAVIKDAMIANVKADKITAGTLNAANVNVINLNANNITTGTIRGANLSMNLNTGEVLFQKGAIRSANGNLNIDIASGRMAVTEQNGDGFFFEDGMLLLSNSWDTGNAIKYGSITYGAGFPASGHGIIIKGASGATLETAGHSGFVGVLTESGINVYPNSINMSSVGKINITGGSEYRLGYGEDRASITIGSSVSYDPGDRIIMNASYIHLLATYRQTASASANVVVTSDGALVRSTSASKYKTDIIRTNATDYGDKLLNLPTATWTDIAETKRYRDDPTTQPEPTRNFGMIAEDLAEAGLEMLVVRGTDGELEGINYDRIGPALIPVIAKLKNEVEILKQKLEEETA